MRPGPPVKMYIAEDVGRENNGTTTAHAEVRDVDIVACFRVLDGREGRFDRHRLAEQAHFARSWQQKYRVEGHYVDGVRWRRWPGIGIACEVQRRISLECDFEPLVNRHVAGIGGQQYDLTTHSDSDAFEFAWLSDVDDEPRVPRRFPVFQLELPDDLSPGRGSCSRTTRRAGEKAYESP